MKIFRIGLIGLGGMAQAHIRWMEEAGERVRLVAVSDVNPLALSETGDKHGISEAKRYADFGQLVADPDVDAVVAVTPNNVHAAIVQACLEAGKPFMAEKPFTRLFEEAVPLLELYERQPVPAMIGFTYRYTPAFRYARELVRQGRIGAVRSFSSQYLQGWGAAQYNCPFVWRFDKAVTGTGTLGDLGSHMIDLARFIFGGEFLELSAQMQTFVPERPDPLTGEPVRIEVDDYVSFQARMTGDIRGVFQSSRNAVGSGNQHEISIYGDTGTIHASTLDGDHLVLIREEEGQLSRSTLSVPKRCKTTQYADFLAVLDGLPADGAPGVIDGYRNQEVLEAIVKASETRSVVGLP